MTPRDLFMPLSHQITAYPYTRPRSCSQSTATLASRQARFYIVCEMGLQTQHHLSSTQTACYQQKQPKNCVAPLMKATDAKPLVSLWSCLRSAVILLSLVPPFLICMRRKQFISSLQIIQRVMMKPARAFGVLSLRRHEIYWISWINEWIKIHLIILQESPHTVADTYTHALAARLPRNLHHWFHLQTNTFNLGVHKERAGEGGGFTMVTARITFCNMSICACFFIRIHGSSMKTILCLRFCAVWTFVCASIRQW